MVFLITLKELMMSGFDTGNNNYQDPTEGDGDPNNREQPQVVYQDIGGPNATDGSEPERRRDGDEGGDCPGCVCAVALWPEKDKQGKVNANNQTPVMTLRKFRDTVLRKSYRGKRILRSFRRNSAPATIWLQKHPLTTSVTRNVLTLSVIKPIEWVLEHPRLTELVRRILDKRFTNPRMIGS